MLYESRTCINDKQEFAPFFMMLTVILEVIHVWCALVIFFLLPPAVTLTVEVAGQA